ncbi:MAG: UDP-glucose/GDP-mannose dehydrogenase family protein [Synergistaceae bacterium]
MDICVIGTGYVGLVTATCFAEKGNNVSCIDIDKKKIENLKNGIIPIYEPGLEDLVISNHAEGRLTFSTDVADGLKDTTKLCFIAVGTPPASDGSADLSQVLAALDSIGESINHSCFIVVKSTVPVGTGTLLCNRIQKHLSYRNLDINLEILSNPEFLKEGMAIEDCLHPDRVVVGARSEEAKSVMRELYKPFASEDKIFIMDPISAEITKYAANTMLASRISFMNEISALCDKVGADILAIKDGIASDRRIGTYFLNAGCGYGGSCFPKDVQALSHIGDDFGIDMTLAKAIEEVNNKQKKVLNSIVEERFGQNLSNLKIVLLGLAFKPQTDDMRAAPAITLIEGLLKAGASVHAYDPVAMEQAPLWLPDGVKYAKNIEDMLKEADCAVLVTEWPEFKELDWAKLAPLMRKKIVIDGRNIYDPETMKNLGFEYYCIGRHLRPLSK